MNTPWMFVTGCTIIGFIAPEVLAISPNIKKVPVEMNIICAIAGGMISGAFV